MSQGAQEQHRYASQSYTQAMQRFQAAWLEQEADNYDLALVFYDQAYQLLQQCVQYGGYGTPHELFYQLAQCCIHATELLVAKHDSACVQAIYQALSHLYQALQYSPNNSIYVQEIDQLQAWLSSFSTPSAHAANSATCGSVKAGRETQLRQIMARMRQEDPEKMEHYEKVFQALQQSDRLLEDLGYAGAVGAEPTSREEWEAIVEADLRRVAEDELTRRELRERIAAEGGSLAEFDAQLYVLDQQKKMETQRWQESCQQAAKAARDKASEDWQRTMIQTERERLGLTHHKPCSCWSCQKGYT